jgi:hypothetical protein
MVPRSEGAASWEGGRACLFVPLAASAGCMVVTMTLSTCTRHLHPRPYAVRRIEEKMTAARETWQREKEARRDTLQRRAKAAFSKTPAAQQPVEHPAPWLNRQAGNLIYRQVGCLPKKKPRYLADVPSAPLPFALTYTHTHLVHLAVSPTRRQSPESHRLWVSSP